MSPPPDPSFGGSAPARFSPLPSRRIGRHGRVLTSLVLCLLALSGNVVAQAPENRRVLLPVRRDEPRLANSRVLPISQMSSDVPSSAFTSVAATTLSWSHTVGANPNRLLLVGVSINSGTTVSGITFGGQPLTLVGARNGQATQTRIEIWRLLAPASGTAAVAVTMSAAAVFGGGAQSFSDVDQTTPLGTFVSAGNNTTTPAVTVASAVGELVFDTVGGRGDVVTLTVGAGQTPLWNFTTGSSPNDVIGGGSTEPGAVSVTMSWTEGGATGKSWAIGAVPIKPVSTPTPTFTSTNTPTSTATATNTPTQTPTNTFTNTPTPTATNTPTAPFTATPTSSATPTPTLTPTSTASNTPTSTSTPSATVTATATAISTPTPTATPTTGTATRTATATGTPTPPPGTGADLAVSKAASSNSANPGQTLTYTVTVSNLGPDTAAAVTLTDPLPPGTKFLSCTAVPGSCVGPPVGSNGTVTVTIGTLALGAAAQVTIVVQVTVAGGNLVNTATASSTTADPDPDNNQSTAVTTVGAGIPMLSPPLQALLALILAVSGLWFARRD